MRTLEIEDEIYQHLLRNTQRIGESASEILRRLLNINDQVAGDLEREEPTQCPLPAQAPNELSECFADAQFRASSDVVRKFLMVLSHVYRRDPEHFGKVVTVSGRKRQYFGRSKEELEQHGRTVMPKLIPESPFWVVTNNDSRRKRRILHDVLVLLGYSGAAIEQADRALANPQPQFVPERRKTPKIDPSLVTSDDIG